jgi:phosphate transport system substrate-binding protein
VPLKASPPFALIDEGALVKPIRVLAVTALSGVLAFGVAACGDDSSDTDTGASGSSSLSGNIKIDGSSTVFPFAQAAAEQFKGEHSGVDISVGESGTGGGFEKFCAAETDVSNASRPIKEDEEAPICEKNGVAYSEVQVANDGIAIITSKDLEIDCMTTEQLKALWNKGSKISNYKDLDPKFPDQKVALFGPGTDSGTFDFFTAAINGEEGDTRKDYSPSEDDNVTVQGVSGDKGGLGYLGFSYFEDNADSLNLVKVDAGDGCVEPSAATIQDGTYKPLARPLFMYPAAKSLARPEVKGFMDYVLANQQAIADASKIVAMTEEQSTKARADLTKAES